MRKSQAFLGLLVGSAVSLNATAALPTGVLPFQVCVANLKPGVEITLETLLLRSSNDDLDYAITVNAGTFPTSPTLSELNSVDPDKFQWGV